MTDIETEKQHISLIEGVECYDKTALKPTETLEKIVLPAQTGRFVYSNFRLSIQANSLFFV